MEHTKSFSGIYIIAWLEVLEHIVFVGLVQSDLFSMDLCFIVCFCVTLLIPLILLVMFLLLAFWILDFGYQH